MLGPRRSPGAARRNGNCRQLSRTHPKGVGGRSRAGTVQGASLQASQSRRQEDFKNPLATVCVRVMESGSNPRRQDFMPCSIG